MSPPLSTVRKPLRQVECRFRDDGQGEDFITIDEGPATEEDAYFRKPVAEAAKSGKPIPGLSNVRDKIVRNGWEQMKKQKR